MTASPWIVTWAGLLPADATVLDIAAGKGRHSRYLAARGHRVTAIDRDVSELATADGIEGVGTILWIHNKTDLLAAVPPDDDDRVYVSAAQGIGLDRLHVRVRALATGSASDGGDGEFSARARHVEALRRAAAHASTATDQLRYEQLELAAEELRLAHDALGEITGRLSADDMLGHIFSTFCIGK